MRVLVVDDDSDYVRLVRRALEGAGMRVVTRSDGTSALDLLASEDGAAIDIILLDIVMPPLSGFEVLQRFRTKGRGTPVIVVTDMDQVDDRVRGLNLGADDYVKKGLDHKELVARIEANARKYRARTLVVHGDLVIDLARRVVRNEKRTLELSPKEFELLRVLASEPRRVWTRVELLEAVWDIEFDPETNVVNVHVARLRKKLGVLGPPVIHTVRGEGYVFGDAPPEAHAADAGSDPIDRGERGDAPGLDDA